MNVALGAEAAKEGLGDGAAQGQGEAGVYAGDTGDVRGGVGVVNFAGLGGDMLACSG